MDQGPIPPVMMMRSFLTVGSSFIIIMIGSIVAMFGIGLAFFPNFAEKFNAGPEVLGEAMKNNPGELIPPLMFWPAVILTVLVCILVGWYIIKTAPFAHFPHAIFVAILLFIYYLQMAIADPPGKKSMTLIFMVAYPLAVLVGAKFAINRIVQNHEPDENDMLDGSNLG